MIKKERLHWDTYKSVMDQSSIRTLLQVVQFRLDQEAKVEKELRDMVDPDPVVIAILTEYDDARALIEEMSLSLVNP